VTTGFILVGQIVAAMLLDHFGLFQNPEHLLNGWRTIGALLMIAGVVLIKTH
jgi:transporter family-2 protein